jgi:colanic acid/amylovoran biosynthesis glycosyltransferase
MKSTRPLRIAYLVNIFPMLSETFVLNQVVGMLQRGHTVDIYAATEGDWMRTHPDIEHYRLRARTHIARLPGGRLARLAGLPTLVRDCKWPLLLLRALDPFTFGEEALSLRLTYFAAAWRPEPYDILHCQFGTLGTLGLALRRLYAPQAKVVVAFRGYDISRHVRDSGAGVYRDLFAQGDLFLPNSDFFGRRLVELGCAEHKIAVHRSGLDCRRFPFRERQARPGGGVRIATVGRLVEKKGVEYAIRALALLRDRHPHVALDIIGDGPLREPLERLVAALGLQDNVRLLGAKPLPEIIALLDGADLFVAPSVTAADGDQDAPLNTLKEAMALGLPVVSTWHGGIPELVEDGVSGYLAPERDAAALADCFARLVAEPERWAAMGRAGRRRVEADYDLEGLNDLLEARYWKLVEH